MLSEVSTDFDLCIRKLETKLWLQRAGKPQMSEEQALAVLEQLACRSRKCFSPLGEFLPEKHRHISWTTLSRLTGVGINSLRYAFFHQQQYFIIMGTRPSFKIMPEAVALVGHAERDLGLFDWTQSPEFYFKIHNNGTI